MQMLRNPICGQDYANKRYALCQARTHHRWILTPERLTSHVKWFQIRCAVPFIGLFQRDLCFLFLQRDQLKPAALKHQRQQEALYVGTAVLRQTS